MRKYLFLLPVVIQSFAIHAQEGTIVLKAYTNTPDPSEWIMVYGDDGLTGYLDANGKEIVPPIYQTIYPFGEYTQDWALVEINEGFVGFIDKSGKAIVEPKYDHIGKFGEYKEDWALVSFEGKYGFINTVGEEIVKPVYGEIPKIAKALPNIK